MRLKKLTIVSCLALLATALTPNLRADEWNKKTILTVNEPLMVPGKLLQPGKYVMKLMDSQSNRHIVQIFNEDESKLQTTILAIPDYRLEPTGKTEFTFWEMPAGQPHALREWFYPGDNFGQQFAYPKELAMEIARRNQQNVPAIVGSNQKPEEAEVREVTPSGEEQAMKTEPQQQQAEQQTQAKAETAPSPSTTPSAEQPESTTPSQPERTETAQAQMPPQQPQERRSSVGQQLPQTGSSLPLLGLIGLLSLSAAGVLRWKARRSQ